jgi:hypothetical protein
MVVHPDSSKMTEAYINQEVFVIASSEEWSASTGQCVKVRPTVMVIGDEDMSASYKQLRSISFR